MVLFRKSLRQSAGLFVRLTQVRYRNSVNPLAHLPVSPVGGLAEQVKQISIKPVYWLAGQRVNQIFTRLSA